jgi:hypothetical protein
MISSSENDCIFDDWFFFFVYFCFLISRRYVVSSSGELVDLLFSSFSISTLSDVLESISWFFLFLIEIFFFFFFFSKIDKTIEIICFSYLILVVAMSLHLPCSVLSFSIVRCDLWKEGEQEREREKESDIVLLTYLKQKKKKIFLYIFHFHSSIYIVFIHVIT